MATVPFKAFGVLLLAGALCAFADDAGKAAAKAFAHPGKAAASKGAMKPATVAPAPTALSVPGPGRMQVEEPSPGPANADARGPQAWQKSHAKGLTEEQKSAFRERKEKMEGMIALIKAKRQALRDAKPEDRAALARELHTLILEKDAGTEPVAASVRPEEKEPDGQEGKEAEAGAAEARGKASETRAQRREEIRARHAERIKQRKNRDDE